MTRTASNAFETQIIEKNGDKHTKCTVLTLHTLTKGQGFIEYVKMLQKRFVVLKTPRFTALSFYCRIIVK